MYRVYTLSDSEACKASPLICAQNDALALRIALRLVREMDCPLDKAHLYCMGTYDPEDISIDLFVEKQEIPLG